MSESHKYIVGQSATFNHSRLENEYGDELSRNVRFEEGKTCVIKELEPIRGYFEEDSERVVEDEGPDAENFYTVTTGMGFTTINHVPETSLSGPSLKGLDEKVEQRLKDQQETKKFKDTEGRVGGSRKEQVAYRLLAGQMYTIKDLDKMEQEDGIAEELIKKDKVFKKFDFVAEREAGVASPVAFLKSKFREAFPPNPVQNKAEYRKIYVGMAGIYMERLSKVVLKEDWEPFIKGLRPSRQIVQDFMSILVPTIFEQNQIELETRQDEIQELAQKAHAAKSVFDDFCRLMAQMDPSVKDDPERPYSDANAIRVKSLTVEDQATYWELITPVHELTDQYKRLKDQATETEKEYGKELRNRFDAYNDYNMIKNTLGEKFAKFVFNIGRNNFYEKSVEKSFEYEGFTLEESLKAIDKYAGSKKDFIREQNRIIDLIKNIKSTEQGDAILADPHLRGYGFGGHGFYSAGFTKKYYYPIDLKTIELKNIWFSRYIPYVQKTIKEQEELVKSIENKYKVRSESWSWAFKDEAQGTPAGPKKKAEITVNVYPPLRHISRKGGMKILDTDISEKTIIEKFGFKTVQFGASLKDNESTEHVRHFLASMADLAEIVNMDVVTLNKLGGLSIAFASRGRGKASAHYEGGSRRIINITKVRGGGAVAHEYMHYIDNILPKIGNFRSSDFASNFDKTDSGLRYGHSLGARTVDNHIVFDAIYRIFNFIYNNEMTDAFKQKYNFTEREPNTAYIEFEAQSDTSYGVPPVNERNGLDIDTYWETLQRVYSQYRTVKKFTAKDRAIYGHIIHKFGLEKYKLKFKSYQSQLYINSIVMSSDYWSRPWELFARSFETYIFDKLSKAGRENNYLVSGVYFDSDRGVYPSGEEREILFHLFDELMAAIKVQYEVPDFKPWNDERVDEYIVLEGDADETVEKGIIVDQQDGSVIDAVGDEISPAEKAALKLKSLARMLRGEKLEKGGNVIDNYDYSMKLKELLLNL
jgi:hypothetical protein